MLSDRPCPGRSHISAHLSVSVAELALVQAEKALLEESCHGKEPRGLLAGLRRRKRTLSWRAPHVEASLPTLPDGEGTSHAIHSSGKASPPSEQSPVPLSPLASRVPGRRSLSAPSSPPLQAALLRGSQSSCPNTARARASPP